MMQKLPTLAITALVAVGGLAFTARADEQAPQRAEPAALADAGKALSNAVDSVCPWFLSGDGYSLPAAQKVAFDAGFGRGARSQMAVLFEPGQMGSASLGFHAVIDKEPADSAMSLFMGFDPTVCQVEVYGHDDAISPFLVNLAVRGWKPAGDAVKHDSFSVQRFYKTSPKAETLVINRWIKDPKAGRIRAIINYLPGNDSVRGELK